MQRWCAGSLKIAQLLFVFGRPAKYPVSVLTIRRYHDNNYQRGIIMKFRHVLVLWLSVLALSCASINRVDVIHQYDPEINFTALKSYDWFPVPEYNIRYDLIVKQIKGEMDSQLQYRGFKRDSQRPDFLIALHGGIQSRLSFPEWEYLSENYKQYAMTRRLDMMSYTDDTFIIDFIDTRTKTLAYRATATAYLSYEPTSEKREEKIAVAVQQILDDYARVVNR